LSRGPKKRLLAEKRFSGGTVKKKGKGKKVKKAEMGDIDCSTNDGVSERVSRSESPEETGNKR